MKVAKNPKVMEFEVQARLFAELPKILGEGFIVRPEVSYNGCRFDLAVFESVSRNLVCVIEVKRRAGNKPGKLKTQKQISKYQAATGKPCILVHDKNIDQFLSNIAPGIKRREQQRKQPMQLVGS